MDSPLRVNVLGAHLFLSRILPGMMERQRGSIINISPVAAFHYTVPHAGYAASKAAIAAMTRDIGFEAAHYGVRVNGIAPGLIMPSPPPGEGIWDSTDAHPLGRGRPSDIANVVAFLASEQA